MVEERRAKKADLRSRMLVVSAAAAAARQRPNFADEDVPVSIGGGGKRDEQAVSEQQ